MSSTGRTAEIQTHRRKHGLWWSTSCLNQQHRLRQTTVETSAAPGARDNQENVQWDSLQTEYSLKIFLLWSDRISELNLRTVSVWIIYLQIHQKDPTQNSDSFMGFLVNNFMVYFPWKCFFSYFSLQRMLRASNVHPLFSTESINQVGNNTRVSKSTFSLGWTLQTLTETNSHCHIDRQWKDKKSSYSEVKVSWRIEAQW